MAPGAMQELASFPSVPSTYQVAADDESASASNPKTSVAAIVMDRKLLIVVQTSRLWNMVFIDYPLVNISLPEFVFVTLKSRRNQATGSVHKGRMLFPR